MKSKILDTKSFDFSEIEIIRDILGLKLYKDEQILWLGKPSWVIFILNSIIEFIICSLSIIIAILISSYVSDYSVNYSILKPIGFCVLIMAFGIAILVFKRSFKLSKTIYLITNRRIIKHQKEEDVKIKFIHFQYVITKEVHKSLLDRLCLTGKIKIYTGNIEKDTDPELVGQVQKRYYYLDTIKNPDNVYRFIRTKKDYLLI